jgi:hypothetical protein
MKRLIFVSVVASFGCLALTLKAQDTKAGAQAAYKVLAMEEGVWDAEITMLIPGSDGKVEPSTSKGVETNRMLGGKWLISDFKGEFGGMSFEGHGLNGYDPKKGKYVGTWVDTMSTVVVNMEGSYDEKTKTLTLNADTENPDDGKPMKMRLETQINDDGTRLYKHHVQMDGQKEFAKLMEIKYTKRKS